MSSGISAESKVNVAFDTLINYFPFDGTKEEITEFLDSMNSNQFKEIENFFQTMPKLSHTVKVYNPQTKVESDVLLEGLASFFG